MAFIVRQDFDKPNAAEQGVAASESAFRVSAEPVAAEVPGAPASVDEPAEEQLPRTYGTQTLQLMARDPRTLFAYWDIEWEKAFAGDPPSDRKVHLRVRTAAGTEETSLEVEPMAGSCYIDVRHSDEPYTAEIGYFQPVDVWNSVARSDVIVTPPAGPTLAATEFATVPFHLSFQRMVDLLRMSQCEDESLTARLAAVRERTNSATESERFTTQEREIVAALEQVIAETPASEAEVRAAAPDLWTQPSAQRILGFGGSSRVDGFGGSSRS